MERWASGLKKVLWAVRRKHWQWLKKVTVCGGVGEVVGQLTGIFAALAKRWSRVLIFCKEGRNRAPNVALWVSWATLLSPMGTPIKVLT